MANCFAHCVILVPAVYAAQITEEMVEPDTDIVAELIKQIHQLRYDYPMDIRNLLNYTVKYLHIFTDGG